jgi:hypothetical protein
MAGTIADALAFADPTTGRRSIVNGDNRGQISSRTLVTAG